MVLNKVCLPSNIGVQQSCQQCWMMRNLFDPGPTTSNYFIAELENRKFSVGTREYSAHVEALLEPSATRKLLSIFRQCTRNKCLLFTCYI